MSSLRPRFVLAAIFCALVSVAPAPVQAASSSAPLPLPPEALESVAPGAWAALGSPAAFSATVFAIAVLGSDVYAGGTFLDAAGIAEADFIARWDGSAWHAVGGSPGTPALNSNVLALSVKNGQLYAAGDFTNADGIDQADRVARWDGSWHAIGADAAGTNGAIPGQVRALAWLGNDLVVGGLFTNAKGIAQADYVALWSNNDWHAIGSSVSGTDGALTGPVWAMVVDGNDLYVGGSFFNAFNQVRADNVAEWTQGGWQALGANAADTDGALNNIVLSLAVFNGEVHAGGSFVNAEGIPEADHLARFDGAHWHALGSNGAGDGAVNGDVWSMLAVGADLYVGGSFINLGGATGDHIARWNGSWHALAGGGVIGDVNALVVDGSVLYAGGSFADAGGIPDADRIAAYGLGGPKPDGRIRKGSGSYVGNNIYNADGTNQTKTGKAARRYTITFGISVQNDGTSSDRFLVVPSGAATTQYRVRYYHGTTEITTAVEAGTFKTPTLAPGAKYLVTAKVKVKKTATVGSSVTRLVTISSVADSGQLDAVKFIGQRK